MTFTTNNRPAAVDLRGLPADVANSIYRPARNASAPAAKPDAGHDPIRDMVIAALQLVGVPTEGKNDVQLLADYTEQLRKTAQPAKPAVNIAMAPKSVAYDLNELIDQPSSYDRAYPGHKRP